MRGILVLLGLLVAAPAMAGDAVFMKDGIAIRGYDAVAYQTEGRAIRGEDRYSIDWHGAAWHFASPENKALFAAEPERWSPQFGGFCAWAMSQGFKAATNPEVFRVVDGRLYLIYSKTTLERWEPEMRTLVPLAEANWTRLWDK
jgi:YHS domain-containing protein